MPEIITLSKKYRPLIAILIAAAAIGLTMHFFASTAPGCENKIFAVGSSLCHQLPSHSFIIRGIQFPVCARCSGLYLGSFIGLVYAFANGRKAGIPEKGYLIMLGIFFIMWGADGVNSGVSEFLNKPFLYRTTNLTRLITGYGMGLLMSTALSTLLNLSLWERKEDLPVLRSPLQVAAYFLICAFASIPFILNSTFLFSLNAYLVTGSAITIISLLYTIFWVILFKKENQFSNWRSAWMFILGGFSSAMLQIILLIALRESVL